MRHFSFLLPALLAGCSAQGLTGEDVCRDMVVAVAARTAECTGDSDAAAEAGEAAQDLDCRIEDLDPDEVANGVTAYYDCIGAVSETSCASVDAALDDNALWPAVTEQCPAILGEGDLDADTGSVP